MKDLIFKIKVNKDANTSGWQMIIVIVIIIVVMINFITIPILNFENTVYTILISLIIITILVIFYIKLSEIQFKLNKTENNLLRILIDFMKKNKVLVKRIKSVIINIFLYYNNEYIDDLSNQYLIKDNNIEAAYKSLSKQSSEAKYFLLYSLLNISSDDGILSINEENCIDDIRKRLFIHDNAYNYIKNARNIISGYITVVKVSAFA